MATWRGMAGVAALLIMAAGGQAQTVSLAETTKAGDCFKIGLEMKLTGELRFNQDGKVVPIPLTASATHQFHERVLAVGKNNLPSRVADVYDTATATISVNKKPGDRELRKDRNLIVVQREQDTSVVFCPLGPLTRQELEVTSEHFDVLDLPALLAGKEVAVGATWKPDNIAVQGLCNFEGLSEQSLTCKLAEVKGDVATVTVTGTAQGIELGALVKVEVNATLKFDVKARRIVSVEWKQTDERDPGPASPASSVETTVSVTRAQIEQPDCLSEVALVSVPEPGPVPGGMLQLEYHDPQGRFDLALLRDWQMVSQTDDHVIFRLMERGDFVAQVTLTPWQSAKKGEHLSPDDFRDAMYKTPGWELGQEVQAGEVPNDGGNYIYRISALGTLDGTEVMQNFYLVATPNGEQMVALFTMTPKKAKTLGDRDLALVGSIAFGSSKKK